MKISAVKNEAIFQTFFSKKHKHKKYLLNSKGFTGMKTYALPIKSTVKRIHESETRVATAPNSFKLKESTSAKHKNNVTRNLLLDQLAVNLTQKNIDLNNSHEILRMSATPNTGFGQNSTEMKIEDRLNDSIFSVPLNSFYMNRSSFADRPKEIVFENKKKYDLSKAQKSYKKKRRKIEEKIKISREQWPPEIKTPDHYKTFFWAPNYEY